MEQGSALMQQLSPWERGPSLLSLQAVLLRGLPAPPPLCSFSASASAGVADVAPQALQARAHLTYPRAQRDCSLILSPMSRPTPVQTSTTHMPLARSLS